MFNDPFAFGLPNLKHFFESAAPQKLKQSSGKLQEQGF